MDCQPCYYAGLDIHKKTIAYCIIRADGKVHAEGSIPANRGAVRAWVKSVDVAFFAGMEATMFTGWVYDTLLEAGVAVEVGYPAMLKAITAGKKKSDRLDARTLANLLRCDMFPSCYMLPSELRQLRQILRYRNLVVRQCVQTKNRTAGLLMEWGQEYDKQKLHGKKYFEALMEQLDAEMPEEAAKLLRLGHNTVQFFAEQQRWLLKRLEKHPQLAERVERLQTIPGVGPVTALTWALEIGDAGRFSSVKKAVSYCGLCAAHHESAGKIQRGPISKKRNEHLQCMLIEAAQLAPRHNTQLAALYQRERERGANHNRATLAVARKLTAYLLYVDKNQTAFEYQEAA